MSQVLANFMNISKSKLQINVYHIACANKFHKRNYKNNNSNNNNGNNTFKKLFLFTSSIFGITLYLNKEYNKENITKRFRYLTNLVSLPNVEAAVPADNSSLKGHREKFNFIADVVKLVAPSVVYIEIKDTRRVDFFTGKPITASNGSGFIIQEDGLILTNAHVVINKPNSRVDVRLHNGKIYTGVVESVDSESDLATVRIPAKGLPTISLGKSSELLAGEWVVAIGAPLTLSNTVTAGVISSVDRGSDELGLRNKAMTYIQTDAAITFGNSGGPLVNLDGEAIGINSMKVTAGISFAIPSDYAKEFLVRSRKTGNVDNSRPRRRYMGITMLTLTPDIVYELRQRKHSVPGDVNHGVLVWKVIVGSPAHSGGLKPGDIVTHINGAPVKSAADIYALLSDPRAEALKMSIVRSDSSRSEIIVVPEG